MAKTKEERRANREIRRARKKLRKEKFKTLLNIVNGVPEPTDDDFLQDPKVKFKTYWPALHSVLDFAASLKVTGEKVDAVLYRIIAVGNKMNDGTANDTESEEFMEKLQQIWGISRKVLATVMILTDDKKDEIIEKAISIGDWISSIDED
jgi:hypothetical protein